MTTRAERAEAVATLRADGKTFHEIADLLGISGSYARALGNDPDGTKDRERKQRYAGTCHRCGSPTNGSNGPAKASDTCGSCSSIIIHESRHWTQERVIDALRAWSKANGGRTPSAGDWLGGLPKGMPPVGVVQREFGSWNAGMVAAGLSPRAVGERTEEGQRRVVAAVRKWAPEQIIEYIRSNSTDGLAPIGARNRSVYRAAQHLYGSWPAACDLAGVTARKPGRPRR